MGKENGAPDQAQGHILAVLQSCQTDVLKDLGKRAGIVTRGGG